MILSNMLQMGLFEGTHKMPLVLLASFFFSKKKKQHTWFLSKMGTNTTHGGMEPQLPVSRGLLIQAPQPAAHAAGVACHVPGILSAKRRAQSLNLQEGRLTSGIHSLPLTSRAPDQGSVSPKVDLQGAPQMLSEVGGRL